MTLSQRWRLAAIPLCTLFFLDAQSVPDFGRSVQPIFEKNCYSCHGEKTQSGGLRLDRKSSALTRIVAGKPEDSEIFRRVSGTGNMAKMPMGGSLNAADVNTIKAWIAAGAVWPDAVADAPTAPKKKHWAFVAPERPALPAVHDARWVRNPIDHFVLAKLESEGLKPSPEAPRETQLRRLSLDLTGLPPTPAELDAFLADKSPRAYEKQVDRLLASPHYGEKFARQWLDGARYADSDGYEKDKPRFVWFYRDWVIDALNRNLPYNEFVVDQIAGDLLPNATQEQRVATGFLRNSMINEEGGVDPEQFRMEAMYDRMDAIGKSILGITIQCAQCHTHKYDPIQHTDYYRMFAFLNNSNEAAAAVYTPAQQMKIAAILQQTREREGALKHRSAAWESRMAAWEETESRNQPSWSVVRPEVDDISTGGAKYLPQPDGSLLQQGYAPTKHAVKLTVKTSLRGIRAIRLELLTDPNLPLMGPGRSIKGTGALSEFTVEAAPAGDTAKFTKLKIARATADLNMPEAPLEPMFFDKTDKKRVSGPIDFAIDGKEETAWTTDAGPGLRNRPRTAVFNFAEPVDFEGGAVLNVYLSQKAGGWNSDDNQNNNLGRVRLSLTTAEDATADPLPANVRQILSTPRAQRTELQNAAVFSYWRTTVPEWKQENDALADLWKQWPEPSSQLVLNERDSTRETHRLNRGDFLQPAEAVTPGVPAFLNPLPAGAPPNRLTFAKWMVARNAPTTARSYVNRLWQADFGIGIVETAEDLGTQSAAPSHPELLDWLAVEFMDGGWNIKAMQKLIVMSATYRQSSNVSPELLAKDPYNRLLARGPRFRVEGETVHDIALAASGLLSDKVGGPSVYPPAPAFLFLPPASYGPKIWNEAKDGERYRRGLYAFRFRSVPYPMLQTFDSPNGESSCVRRSRSNTPLQALTALNEPLFVESARALASDVMKHGGGTDGERLNYAMRRVVARRATAAENAELLGLLNRERQKFASGAHDPKLLADGADGAAWTLVSRVLLNLDETITKE